jgi:hypothetical protein
MKTMMWKANHSQNGPNNLKHRRISWNYLKSRLKVELEARPLKLRQLLESQDLCIVLVNLPFKIL